MVSVPLNFRLSLSVYKEGFPGGAVVKNPPATAGDLGSIPGLRWFPGKWNGNLLCYSCQENPIDKRSLAAVRGVTESDMTGHTHTHVSTKKCAGIFIKIVLILLTNLGRIDIFTILIIPVYKIKIIYLYLFMSSLFSFFNTLTFYMYY